MEPNSLKYSFFPSIVSGIPSDNGNFSSSYSIVSKKMVSQKLMEFMMRCLTMDMFYVKLDMKSSCKINPNLTISYPALYKAVSLYDWSLFNI